jgi:molybdopterin-guanine dinucleotide biosynthesis protein A
MSGLVLAGGASRRMGRDKAQILFDSEPLVIRAVRRLARVCTDVVVASGDGHRLDHLGVTQVADALPGAGPLAGIAAGLESARHDLVAVIAVDMPAASPAVLALLAGLWRGEAAVVPVVAGRSEPLHAVWARSAAPGVVTCLEAGERRVMGALSTLGARLVGEAEWEPAEAGEAAEPKGPGRRPGRFAANLNAPMDLFCV